MILSDTIQRRCCWAFGTQAIGLVLALLANASVALAQEQSAPAGATVIAKKWTGNGLRLELAPLTQDQVRAFFIGRGFKSADASFIAQTGCIFRSAIGNAGSKLSDPDIAIKLAKWRLRYKGKIRSPMTRETWAQIWQERKVKATPVIAFHWALFPTQQQHKPTDYNWGMVAFGLPPGAKFDLDVKWSMNGKGYSHLLTNLECGK